MASPPSQFVTTRWSQVLAAGRSDSTAARASLETLCRAYWYPLYAFARRFGRGVEDAQDLTQEFFARLLERNYLGAAEREKGRFRTFLISSFKHFLINEWRREQTRKRGGDCEFVPIDSADAESRYGVEPTHELAPDQLFERRWAMTVLDRALARLRREYEAAGKGEVFEQLKEVVAQGGSDVPYAELAARLQITEGAVKVAVHRLRRRYRETLRQEIGDTVGSEAEIDEELQNLMAALRGSG